MSADASAWGTALALLLGAARGPACRPVVDLQPCARLWRDQLEAIDIDEAHIGYFQAGDDRQWEEGHLQEGLL